METKKKILKCFESWSGLMVQTKKKRKKIVSKNSVFLWHTLKKLIWFRIGCIFQCYQNSHIFVHLCNFCFYDIMVRDTLDIFAKPRIICVIRCHTFLKYTLKNFQHEFSESNIFLGGSNWSEWAAMSDIFLQPSKNSHIIAHSYHFWFCDDVW